MKIKLGSLVLLLGLTACSLSQVVSVAVSSPTNNATVSSPVHVAATAYAKHFDISRWEVDVDNAPAYTTGPATSISADLVVSNGTHQLVVRVWDSKGHSASASSSITVKSTTTVTTALSITTSSLPGGTAGTAYSAVLAASGGTSPYTWTVSSGQIPPGLKLSSSGTIQGTPSTSGQFTFGVQAKDSATTPQTASKSYTVGIAVPPPTPLTIAVNSLPNATVGTPYSTTLQASGGTPPYTWTQVGGVIPPGLALATSGPISGTPTAAGQDSFSVQVKDSATSQQAAQSSFTISVASATSTGTVLWSASMETGNISEWYSPSTQSDCCNGGSADLSGIASAVASKDHAHSGAWSAKLSITTPDSPTSGARMFRWLNPRQHQGAYYSIWIYIPQFYTLTGNPSNGHFWNLFQFKSRTADNSRIDPVWAWYIDDSVTGHYYLETGWGWGGTILAGPYSTSDVSGKFYTQRIAELPVGRWVHLEAYLFESSSYNGHITFWQDGAQIFDFSNIITSYYNCNFNAWCADNEWSVNLYSDGLSPNPAFIYVDDGKISTGYIP